MFKWKLLGEENNEEESGIGCVGIIRKAAAAENLPEMEKMTSPWSIWLHQGGSIGRGDGGVELSELGVALYMERECRFHGFQNSDMVAVAIDGGS